MHPRLELNMRRVAVGNIMDSIDQLDPSSRTRQPTALSLLQARFFSRRIHLLLLCAGAAVGVLLALAAIAHWVSPSGPAGGKPLPCPPVGAALLLPDEKRP